MREEDKCEDERGTIGWDKQGCFSECKGEDKTKSCYLLMRDIK